MKDFELLMKYRDGDLEEGERIKLKSLIEQQDEEISEMMAFLDELDEAIGEDHVEDFEKKLSKLLGSNKKKKKDIQSAGRSKVRRLKKYYVAASLFLFFVVGSVLLIVNRANNPNRLFLKYYTSYIADVVTRSSDMNMEPELDQAFEYYNNREYPLAIARFSKLAENEEYTVVSHFHLGMSYLELGMYQKAGNNLKEVLENDENIYTLSAKWYLSLCLIKQDKTEEARELLQELEQVKFYSDKATELLESLP